MIKEFSNVNPNMLTLSEIRAEGYQQGRADQLEEDKGKDWELMLIELGRKESRAETLKECWEKYNKMGYGFFEDWLAEQMKEQKNN